MASTYRKDGAGGIKKKSLNKTFTPMEKKSLNKTFVPMEKKSLNKTFVPMEKKSLNKTFVPMEKKSLNKTFTPMTTSKTSGRGNNLAPLSSSTRDRYNRKTKSLLDKR